MSSHRNVDVLRRLYDATRTGDTAALEELHTADFRLSVSGSSAVSGVFEGVEGAAGQFERSMSLTGGQLDMAVLHLLADDDLGMALLPVRGRRPDGRQAAQDLIHEVRFSGDKVSAIREWIWDQEADRAFWA